MVHNYLSNIERYTSSTYPMTFFSYIAGGFGTNIDKQLQQIYSETGVPGAAVSVSNIIKMVEVQESNPYSHKRIKDIFSVNRQVVMSDL